MIGGVIMNVFSIFSFERICIKHNVVCLFFIVVAYQGLSQTFSNVAVTLPPLGNAKTQWADFNNDDLLDIFISGTTAIGAIHTAVYYNNGNNTFNAFAFPALNDIAFDIGDYDKDGFADIIMHGTDLGLQPHTRVFQNSGGAGFILQNYNLVALSRGGLLWFDLDNDSDLDIVSTGLDEALNARTIVYEWRENTYYEKTTNVAGVSNGDIKKIDINSDGKFEVLISGLDASGGPTAIFYAVSDSLVFTIVNNALAGFAFNSISAADLNHDGFADFVTTGFATDDLLSTTSMFVNTGSGGFILSSQLFENVSASCVTSGDMNNDGLSDVLLGGHNDVGFNFTEIYLNTANGNFIDLTHSMSTTHDGDISTGDVDNDGDLDIFRVGFSDIGVQSNLYTSDAALTVGNNAPSNPTNLQAETNSASVTLSWDVASDDHTPSESISYNVFISTDQNGVDLVLAPLANISNGYVRLPEPGNNGMATARVINNLPEGRYYWSVQAIDNGYKGSAFSTVQSFSICHTIHVSNDATLCAGSNFSVQTGTAVDVVDWHSRSNGVLLSNSNAFSYAVEATDTLIVEVTRPFGCSARDTIYINVVPLPVVSLGDDLSVCHLKSIELSVITDGDSVNWYVDDGVLLPGHSTKKNYRIQSETQIIVEVYSFPFQCMNSDTLTVSPLPLPVASAGEDISVCYGGNAQLNIDESNVVINWKALQADVSVSNNNAFQFEVRASDTVVLEVVDANQCVGYDSLMVTMLLLPAISLGQDQEICFDKDVDFSIPESPVIVKWKSVKGEILATDLFVFQHHVVKKDTVVAEITDNNNCVNRDSVIIHVLPLPYVDIGKDTSLCFSETILLQAGPGLQKVDWISKNSGFAIMEDQWFLNYNVVETDTIIVNVRSTRGCENTDSVRIEKLDLPDFSLGQDINTCDGSLIGISIEVPSKNVTWYSDEEIIIGTTSTLQFVPQQSMNLYATVIGLNDCLNYDTISVNVLALPVFDLGLDRSVCSGDTVSLSTSRSAESYSWTNDILASLPNLPAYNFISVNSRWVALTIVDDKSCVYRDSIFINVNALPEFSIEGEENVCAGEEASLYVDVPTFQSLVWRQVGGGVINQDVLSTDVLFAVSTHVMATLTDVNLCSSSDTVFIEVYNLPDINAGRDTLLCYGESVFLGGDNAEDLIFTWTPSQSLDDPNARAPQATPSQSTLYTLWVEDEHGCRSGDSVFVDVNPQIVLQAGENVSICVGESVELGGGPTASGSRFPYSHQWVDNMSEFVSHASNPVVEPVETTMYYLFVTTGRCEVFLDSVLVRVNTLPVLEAIPTYSVGVGGTVQLEVQGAFSYEWAPKSTLDDPLSSRPIASPLLTTSYVVKGIDINGCVDTASVVVLVQNTLFIPSLFTPNGDGNNDVLKIFGSGVEEIAFSVFDQSGLEVFHTRDIAVAFDSGWDGTKNGQHLPNDIYVWVVEGKYYNGDPVLFNGKSRGIVKLFR
jgi:gliding motility-associated-like protein